MPGSSGDQWSPSNHKDSARPVIASTFLVSLMGSGDAFQQFHQFFNSDSCLAFLLPLYSHVIRFQTSRAALRKLCNDSGSLAGRLRTHLGNRATSCTAPCARGNAVPTSSSPPPRLPLRPPQLRVSLHPILKTPSSRLRVPLRPPRLCGSNSSGLTNIHPWQHT